MLQASDTTRPLLGETHHLERETTEAFEIAGESSGPTERLAGALRNKECGYCTMTAVVLFVVNSLSCFLLVFIGDTLGDLETLSEYDTSSVMVTQYNHNTGRFETSYQDRRYYNSQQEYYRRERRETIMAVVSMVVFLLVNLGTIYFLCKTLPAAQGSRFYKAGMAVFGCCRSRKEYEEANVPVSEVLANIWARSKPCEVSRQSLMRGLVLAFVAFCVFAMTVIFDVQITPQGLMVFLCVPAVLLWIYLCKLASQGDFFADEEFMASISDEGGCNLTEDQEESEESLQSSMNV